METHDFSNAKAGDLVTDLIYGHGVIVKVDNSEWPLDVKFDTGCEKSFTKYGKEYLQRRVSLYHGHVDFKIETIEPCPYEIGEWIAVRDFDDQTWEIAQLENIKNEKVVANGHQWLQHRPLSSFNQSK